MRPRQIAPVTLVLALTIAGFVGARALGERDARDDASHRAEVAATQIRARLVQGSALAESLRLVVARGGAGATGAGFAADAADVLGPAGFPAAAWVEQVPAARRGAYERRVGHPIATQDRRETVSPEAARASYLPATLVSGVTPMAAAGLDLGITPGIRAAVARASRLYDAGATPLGRQPDGTRGLFLVRFAPRLDGQIVQPGFVVVFVPELALRSAATAAPQLRLATGAAPAAEHGVHETFAEAGQRFDVMVPRESASGAGAVLPWIILAAGLVLAGLTAALGLNAARRTRAQAELDRVFELSPDIIAVADFDGHFKRVNPAVEQVLGYTPEEFVAKPYLELVHPDDREKTAGEAAAIAGGKTAVSFENRFVHKDGSTRVLQWTSTPVVSDRLMYGVARNVTEHRLAEAEQARLGDEQAALRRVATLVAQGAPPATVFDAVAAEMLALLQTGGVSVCRYEEDGELTIVAHRGAQAQQLPPGRRIRHDDPDSVTATVRRTGRPARRDSYASTQGTIGQVIGQLQYSSGVGVPIVVDGRVWGVTVANWMTGHSPPPETEQRMAQFGELLDTAIANADGRDQLTASRARLVTEADEARRRLVRDLHDGAQQRLVHTIVTLKLATRQLLAKDGEAASLVSEALEQAERSNAELRELAHGILPAALTLGGLQAGVGTVVSRVGLPVELRIPDRRFAPEIEASAYFVVAEALTNVVKHAQARSAAVTVSARNAVLEVEVRDDGIGGADPDGHGLVGMNDRVNALGGRLTILSPPGGGTLVTAVLPLGGDGTS